MNKRTFLFLLNGIGTGKALDARSFKTFGANTMQTLIDSNRLNIPTFKNMGLGLLRNIENFEYAQFPIADYGELISDSASLNEGLLYCEMFGESRSDVSPDFEKYIPQSILRHSEPNAGCKLYGGKQMLESEAIKKYWGQSRENNGCIICFSPDNSLTIISDNESHTIEHLHAVKDSLLERLPKTHSFVEFNFKIYDCDGKNLVDSQRVYEGVAATKIEGVRKKSKKLYFIGSNYDVFGEDTFDKTFNTSNDTETIRNVSSILASSKFNEGLFVTEFHSFADFGSKRDIDSFTNALNKFDNWLGRFIKHMKKTDRLILVGTYGCDPAFRGFGHTRETVPIFVYHHQLNSKNLGLEIGLDSVLKYI
ncbi:MAG: hypothetical protein UH542_01060 [Bacteroidales bacterium]|nr:hypothetical protein [Bacteroidales bacterium]